MCSNVRTRNGSSAASCCLMQPTSWYRTALEIIFGADNVEAALRIYPAPSEGEDIRPRIAVSDV